jgi:predicted dehydrogenase
MTEKIKLAIVGLEFGLQLFKTEYFGGNDRAEKYFDLVACCDLDKDKASAYAQEHGIKAYYDMDAMLADTSAEIVALFTGPNGRAKMIDKIISSGRDVITTKPFENDAEEAARIIAKAKKIGRLIYLNSPNPVPPADIAQIMEWKDRYDLGRLIAIRHETWCNYREHYDGSWYDDPKKCPVAPVFRLGIYGINDVLRFTSAPAVVQAMETKIFTQRQTSDNALLAVSFEQGEIATFFASFCISDNKPYPDKLILNFERGTIQKNSDLSIDVMKSAQMQLVTSIEGRSITETAVVDRANASGCYMWDVFYQGFKNRTWPQLSDDIIPNGIKITQAMYKAVSTGKAFKL